MASRTRSREAVPPAQAVKFIEIKSGRRAGFKIPEPTIFGNDNPADIEPNYPVNDRIQKYLDELEECWEKSFTFPQVKEKFLSILSKERKIIIRESSKDDVAGRPVVVVRSSRTKEETIVPGAGVEDPPKSILKVEEPESPKEAPPQEEPPKEASPKEEPKSLIDLEEQPEPEAQPMEEIKTPGAINLETADEPAKVPKRIIKKKGK